MRILVLGAAGMLGHKLVQLLAVKNDVFGTIRGSVTFAERYGVLKRDSLIEGVDVNDFDKVIQVVSRVRPQCIINCIGIIKQLEAAKDPLIALTINSLFPHKLANLCRVTGVRLVQISTDCVFSGQRGMYKESDVPDPVDLYGRTKLLGEVDGPHCLTLRTSIIGRELGSVNGLIEWFLQTNQTEVKGFLKAIYTGLTTIEFSRVLAALIEANNELTGIYHVSSDPISKYDLLLLAQEAFHVSRKVVPIDTPVIDRSLDSTHFRKLTGYNPPSWKNMIHEMAVDITPYARFHNH